MIPVVCSIPSPVAAAGGCAAAGFDRLHDLETFAEALIVYDLALAQKVQRFDDLAVVRHVHQMLIRRPRLLLGRHVLTQIRDRIAGAGDVRGRKGHAVRVGGEDAVRVQHIIAVEPRGGQLLQACTLHALRDHRRDHLPVRDLLGADVGQRRADAVVGHGIALREIPEPRAELCVCKQRDKSRFTGFSASYSHISMTYIGF